MRQDRQRVATAFGKALRQAREHADLSQEELADRAKVDRTFVSRAESGKRQPALTTVFLLAKALGIRPALLIEHAHKHLSG